MSSKHFIDDPTHLVNTALHSLTLANPNVALDSDSKIVYRRPSHDKPQVSIISGGGSGHEPSFGAMVGPGMLSAAVAGTIFASPSAEQVRTAIAHRVDTSRGVLVVVMNYTGDVLNFGMAVEKAKAAGLPVDMVVVGDDVGVGRAKAGKVGRRGIAGTVLVLKIAGALAAQGRSLGEVAKVARLAADNIVSVGASLEHVHVPGRAVGAQDDTLAQGEVEIGMGIHNEAGSERAKLHLPRLVGRMLAQLLDSSDEDRAFLKVNSNEVVLMINNLGSVSVLEMGGITTEVVTQLGSSYGIHPVRIITGTFMTSLNGLGFSVSLLNVVNTDVAGPGMMELLDAGAEVTGWSAPIRKETWEAKNVATRTDERGHDEQVKPSGLRMDKSIVKERLELALDRVIAAEPEITRYDTVVGDGDCGIGLKRGAEAVLKHIGQTDLTDDPLLTLASIIPIVESTMDGTSGALYAIFLNALARALRSLPSGDLTPSSWAEALQQSCDALSKYTPARPGDRTLVDALYPFIQVLGKTRDVKKAAEAAKKAADETRGMQASLGRAVYVGGKGFEQVPDPGAFGLACFFGGLAGGGDEEWERV
ncbi:dihydroxyacetone kinase [Metarhizium album ARSEF 1941]|uniref:Dihydroxyacetone kinase n=1 Tax=Metarhizium album (strain ARSEF 1941) TaxID=1081103 RepID=A0A0B2X854_METAS|nr:dihydroxyacetone kinase [Metarhizium album ARSEF 1941]KHO01481.1 dihydroxyacetone kinase [Metarhizium album ARSEF 1941]